MICRCQCLATGQVFAVKFMEIKDGSTASKGLREMRGLLAVKGLSSFLQLQEIIMLPAGMAIIMECAPFL